MTQVPKQSDDLDDIPDEELSAWYEQVRRPPELVFLERGEGSFPVWHGQRHAAEPTPLSHVREALRRAGYTAAKVRQGDRELNNRGTRRHNEWHLTHPGVRHR